MKDKSIITEMIFTEDNSEKLPIDIVGEPKKPVWFSIVPRLPMPYTNHHNVIFLSNHTL